MSYEVIAAQVNGRRVVNIVSEGMMVGSVTRAQSDEPESALMDFDIEWAEEVDFNEVIRKVRALL